MTTYNSLKKIIPPDQALANQALSRGLRQVKQIFDTDLPTLSRVVENLETNKDLNLINALEEPLPSAVANFWANNFATGTGPGNTFTTNDVIGIAAGATVNDVLPDTTSTVEQLANIGALNTLTANGGTPSSSINGVYTVMQYCLANAYTTTTSGPPDTYTITIPGPLPGQGIYGPDGSIGNVMDQAFANLIIAANARINAIASSYPDQAQLCNDSSNAIAQQLVNNQNNCIAAGIDVANVVFDMANANLVSNSISSSLQLTERLHDIGLQVEEGGAAQFFDNTANINSVAGQAVIASLREGRNLALLNSAGIIADTQVSSVNANLQIANNISNAQYSVSEARANIVI